MSSESAPSTLLDTWTETSSIVFDSMIAANRAAFAAFGLAQTGPGEEVAPPIDRIGPDGELPEWHVETTTEDPEELGVGDRFQFTKTISDADIRRFATASGDTNPLHLDEDFAETTRFKGRIAHGTLVGGLISAALARVPGLVIYLSQELEFHNPVRVDDRVTARCEIVEDLGNDQFRLTTRVLDGEDVVIDGEAVIMVDSLPEDREN
ncbi:MAG: MaoC family dehydratase [Haloarculaceae archaeon]